MSEPRTHFRCFHVQGGVLLVGGPEPVIVNTQPWFDGAPLSDAVQFFERMANALRAAPEAVEKHVAEMAAQKEKMS